MPVYVNTNTQSIFAQRALSKGVSSLQSNIEKLSTGFRINRAADDSAGLSISEKLTSQIRGLEKAEQNIGDGISLVQTAEGALSVVQDNLQRMRELMVQAENGTNSANELNAIQRELNARITTIGDIGTQTEFNGISLLDGGADITLQTGADNGQSTTIALQSGTAVATGIEIDITAAAAAGAGGGGALVEGVTAGFQLNELHLTGATGVDSLAGNANNSTFTLAHMDTILDNVSRMRSELGAVQNSLESKSEYLNVAKENASASRSRIKDVDVAAESSDMIKNQIIQQSAAAMLSQANSTPQLALSLLP